MDKISVEPFYGSDACAASNDEDLEQASRTRQPRTGDEIYARVTKVEDRFAKVDILAIGEEPISAVFAGFIQ